MPHQNLAGYETLDGRLFHNSECLSEADNDAPETRAANRQVVDTRPDAPISRVLRNVRIADVSSHTRNRCIAIGRVMA
jgi:hypothetical protein